MDSVLSPLFIPNSSSGALRIGFYEDLSVDMKSSCEELKADLQDGARAFHYNGVWRKSGKWDKSVHSWGVRGSRSVRGVAGGGCVRKEGRDVKEKRWKVMNDRAISYGAGGCPTLWPRRHCSRTLQLPVAGSFSPLSLRPPSQLPAGVGRVRFLCARVKNAFSRLARKSSAMFAGESMIAHSCLTFLYLVLLMCTH